MLQAHFQNGLHMVICQGIQNIFTLTAVFDQVHLLQHPKLMGDGTLGQLYLLGDIRNALLLFCQQIQDMHTGGIRKALEQFADKVHDLLFRDRHGRHLLRFSLF